MTTGLARVLRAEPWVASVHTAVAGLAIAHYQQHVLARTLGTPDEVPWHASDDWDGAHRGDDAAAAVLCDRLGAVLDRADPAPSRSRNPERLRRR
ncbi:hypothetical protein [Pseudonocardia sp.]|uniref:hypothetical protein n=1 Tax=Pseudonocardia sp. TaxID=60912 RepID=UPI00261ED941|nr:hypothetical protein [Pseudonocardia sp.]